MPTKKKQTAKKTAAKKKPAIKKAVIKKSRKKSAKRPAVKKATAKKQEASIIGVITHYFPKVRAAVVKLKAPLSIGDTIKIKGHTTDFAQTVSSIQLEHVAIDSAKKGQEIGLLVDSRARQHDMVYKA